MLSVALLERVRLVTLTGVGGVGKTSLALAVAASSTGSFPDGCWFAELAPVSAPGELVRAVAAAMGTAAPELEGLARFLSDRRVLLVIDNAEHVLSDAARLVGALLAAGPEVVILVTSREPLGVRGEVVRDVRSLDVPDPAANAIGAAGASAVSLFVARASAASERFTLDDSNVDAVVEICRRLDGIPLAIELAAARVRGMGPAEIARRLSERFRLLIGGGALERQRTLLGTVAWSHDLLTDGERVVFRRLAVFPASFSLAAAEAVAGDDALLDVMDCVLRLVDRSLVVCDPTSDRYRLLETMRQFAADRLGEAGETDLVRDCHTAFYLALAAQTASGGESLSTAAQRAVRAEMDNLRASVNWLGLKGRSSDLLALCRGLFAFLVFGAPLDGYRWYRAAIADQRDLDGQERVDTLGEFDILRLYAGEASDDGLAGAAIAFADSAGLSHSPWAWFARSIAINAVDSPSGKLAAEAGLRAAEERADELAVVLSLAMLSAALATLDELDRSFELVGAEALRRGRAFSHPDALAGAVLFVAAAYLNLTEPDLDGAMRILKENPVDVESASPVLAVWLHRDWGLAYLGLGDLPGAIHHLTASIRVADRSGHHAAFADPALALGLALVEAGHPALGAQIAGYIEANFTGRSMGGVGSTRTWARLAAAQGSLDGVEWTATKQSGARLDRKGFMRLLAEAEQIRSKQTPVGR